MFDNSLEGSLLADGVSAQGTTGTSEEFLKTFVLKANELTRNGQRLRIRAFGHGAANSHNKTWTLYFGSQSVTTGTTTGSGDVVELSMEVIRLSASTQQILANVSDSATGALAKAVISGTQNLAADLNIQVSVTGGTSGADLFVDSFVIEQCLEP